MQEREDLRQIARLEKAQNLDQIDFSTLMKMLVSFTQSRILATPLMRELGFSDQARQELVVIHNVARDFFFHESIKTEALANARVRAWEIHDRYKGDLRKQATARMVVSCLYEYEASEVETYGAGEITGVIFSVLLDIHPNHCREFADFAIDYLKRPRSE